MQVALWITSWSQEGTVGEAGQIRTERLLKGFKLFCKKLLII